ncbi:MAG: lipopolysaccharide heptosyltransferase II [Candidatus Omnitrophota bacterium]
MTLRSAPRRILIINPFGIGDVLFTTPVVKAIKESWPDAFIGYWSNLRVASILENNPRIAKVFALSRGDLKKIYHEDRPRGIRQFFQLLKDIRKERFDICLDFSLDHRYSLISKILGIKRRAGFNYKKRGRFLTDKVDISSYQNRHVVEYYLSLLNFIGIGTRGVRLELFVSKEDAEGAASFLEGLRISRKDYLIGIAPGAGASWGEDASLKHWPAIKFAQLADNLINEFKAKVLLLGGKDDVQTANIMLSAMNNKVVNLVGETTLNELAAIIDRLDMLVANDGGPLHMAVALDKRTLSFYGPVSPQVYGPYPPDAARHTVLYKGLACSPCYNNFRLSPCQDDKGCLEEITIGEGLNAASRIISLINKEDKIA